MKEEEITQTECVVAGGYSCGGCAELGGAVREIAGEFPNAVFRFVSAETDADVFRQYGIDRVPCLIVTKSGSEVGRCYGYQPPEILLLWLQNVIGTK